MISPALIGAAVAVSFLLGAWVGSAWWRHEMEHVLREQHETMTALVQSSNRDRQP